MSTRLTQDETPLGRVCRQLVDGYVRIMKLPDPRGPLSAQVNDHLLGQTDRIDPATCESAMLDEHDRAITLWVLHELHHHGFVDVEDDREWDPELIRLRSLLEAETERRLRQDFEQWEGPRDFWPMLEHFGSEPGLADFVRTRATQPQVLQMLREKSVYHLKESDPHCFVLPRLEAAPKAALAELQYDELGGGQPERVHSALFADALRGADLDPTYGAFVNQADTSTLVVNNVISMFCLRRRLRFAAAGHLAAFEATSSLPCAAIVRGLRRLGFDERVVRYYDEHVEADAVHEQLAWRDICGRLADGDPDNEHEILFGAFACVFLESRNAAGLIAGWR